MIKVADILETGRVSCLPRVSSKKRALELLSGMLTGHLTEVSQLEAFESLFERERLGSTGLGHNVAIPHGRTKSLERPVGAFLHLKQGVDYDSADGRPVHFIFALLVPEAAADEHLDLLAFLAEMFSDEGLCSGLRNAMNKDDVFRMLTAWHPRENNK